MSMADQAILGAEAASDTKRFANLRRWNIAVVPVFLVQAILILALSNGFSIPVIVQIQTDIPGSAITLTETVTDRLHGRHRAVGLQRDRTRRPGPGRRERSGLADLRRHAGRLIAVEFVSTAG